jgi:hypothetical protein
MQDDQIGLKFKWFAPAYMAKLPHLINTKKYFFVVNNLVSYFELALLTRKLSIFD